MRTKSLDDQRSSKTAFKAHKGSDIVELSLSKELAS